MGIRCEILEETIEQNRKVDEQPDKAVIQPCFWQLKANVSFDKNEKQRHCRVGFIQVLEADDTRFVFAKHYLNQKYKNSLPLRDGGESPPFYTLNDHFSQMGEVGRDDRPLHAEMNDSPLDDIPWQLEPQDELLRVIFHRKFSLWLGVQDYGRDLEPIHKNLTVLKRWKIEIEIGYKVKTDRARGERCKQDFGHCQLSPVGIGTLPPCVWDGPVANDAEVESVLRDRRPLPPFPPPHRPAPPPPPRPQNQIDHEQRIQCEERGQVRFKLPRDK